jgi:hypothetical protein
MHRKPSAAAVLSIAALVVALVGAPRPSVAQSYQGTPTPAISGTRTLEQSPATVVHAPRGAPAPAGMSPAIGGTSEPAPGLSFGAAPAPIVSPNR